MKQMEGMSESQSWVFEWTEFSNRMYASAWKPQAVLKFDETFKELSNTVVRNAEAIHQAGMKLSAPDFFECLAASLEATSGRGATANARPAKGQRLFYCRSNAWSRK